ncbi:MAG: phosphoglycerate dehydrogenase-like enzyme [Gammaproteobacteria bacterium]|jgi:phosphoglycerate dehydrogenase-like enzyme
MESIVVSFKPGQRGREQIMQSLGDIAKVVFLDDVDESARRQVLQEATLLLSRNTAKEFQDAELESLAHLSLIQFMSAGVDFVPLFKLPSAVPVAVNAGAYAQAMAEHALAMILAAAKRLLPEHMNLTRGEFNQYAPSRMLQDMTVGILGFGGIGVACARLLRVLGVRVHAINRRGHSEQPVDWMGAIDDIDELLASSDALILSLPLTGRTEGLIGAQELAKMKTDAMIVNLARGEIIDELALFNHLQRNPAFTACIDAWWVEPVRHGEFRMDQAFLTLPNVIGSPHNSATVNGSVEVALRAAMANCRRVLEGHAALHLVGDDERMFNAP